MRVVIELIASDLFCETWLYLHPIIAMEYLVEQQNDQGDLHVQREETTSTLDAISCSDTSNVAAVDCLDCYVCGSSKASDLCKFKCQHSLCLECIQSQIEHLPKPGEQFFTRNAKCGLCSSWIEYENLPQEFVAVKQREHDLLERLKADKDPDPELAAILADGSLLVKWQFMICV